MFCHHCNALLEDGALFCSECGTRVKNAYPTITLKKPESSSEQAWPPPSSEEQIPAWAQDEVSSLPPSDTPHSSSPSFAQNQNFHQDHLEAVIAENTLYYMPEFEKVRKLEKTKFNIPAFLFNIWFCFYRKCGDLFKRYFLLPILLFFVLLLLFVISLAFLPVPVSILAGIATAGASIWFFVNALRLGFNFNWEYYQRCQDVLAKKEWKKYGVSITGAVLSFLVSNGLFGLISLLSIFIIFLPLFVGDGGNWNHTLDNMTPSIEEALIEDEAYSTAQSKPIWCQGIYYSEDTYSTLTFADSDSILFDMSIYRLTQLENCIGAEQNGRVLFTGSPDGESEIGGVITYDSSGIVNVRVIESEWQLIPVGTIFTFYTANLVNSMPRPQTPSEELTQQTQNTQTQQQTQEASVQQSNDNYILPNSDSRYISRSELSGFSAMDCRLARNEIYARHGRMFEDATLQAHFNACSWYTPTVKPDDFKEEWLNKYETANRDLIVKYESEKGYR